MLKLTLPAAIIPDGTTVEFEGHLYTLYHKLRMNESDEKGFVWYNSVILMWMPIQKDKDGDVNISGLKAVSDKLDLTCHFDTEEELKKFVVHCASRKTTPKIDLTPIGKLPPVGDKGDKFLSNGHEWLALDHANWVCSRCRLKCSTSPPNPYNNRCAGECWGATTTPHLWEFCEGEWACRNCKVNFFSAPLHESGKYVSCVK